MEYLEDASYLQVYEHTHKKKKQLHLRLLVLMLQTPGTHIENRVGAVTADAPVNCTPLPLLVPPLPRHTGKRAGALRLPCACVTKGARRGATPCCPPSRTGGHRPASTRCRDSVASEKGTRRPRRAAPRHQPATAAFLPPHGTGGAPRLLLLLPPPAPSASATPSTLPQPLYF